MKNNKHDPNSELLLACIMHIQFDELMPNGRYLVIFASLTNAN